MAGYTDPYAHNEMEKATGAKKKTTLAGPSNRIKATKQVETKDGKRKVKVPNATGGGYHYEYR